MSYNTEQINNEKDEAETRQVKDSISKSVKFYFPWFSALFSLLVITFLFIISQPELVNFYHIPVILVSTQTISSLIIILGLIYLLDIRHFQHTKTRYHKQLENLQQQLDAVWQSKKKQQQRANIYLDHREKLKYFISEKLLETIEYDDKYLHFKNIAAEVRHNGVISYDKVITALNNAIEQYHRFKFDEEEFFNKNLSRKEDIELLAGFQSALDAVRYLWDLLDLSTAENMSLHIGNQLIESEEHFYQLNLDTDRKFDITQSIPIVPTFHPQLPVLMALDILIDDGAIKNQLSLYKDDPSQYEKTFLFESDQFNMILFSTPALLGNHNHVVLLLENIIKNAQFFQQKVRYKQSSDRIAIRLFCGEGYVNFTIYNRGPQIKVEKNSQIFKLGYSTRKQKQNHGKGLGLYFANEIVKGYNGSIEVNNINNVEMAYTLKLNFSQGDSIIYTLACRWVNNRMKAAVILENNTEAVWENELKFTCRTAIDSIDIFVKNSTQDLISTKIDKHTAFNWLDPSPSQQAKWLIQLKAYKRKHNLIFKPLDICGVCFDIKLPTAISRMNEPVDELLDDLTL